jgi:hypothetical protein
MWTIWRINWQIVQISVSCKIFVLTSKYLLSNIIQKLFSIIDIISENCRTLHLYPLNVNVIQMVTQSVQYSSARLLIYCELLYRQRGIKNSVLWGLCPPLFPAIQAGVNVYISAVWAINAVLKKLNIREYQAGSARRGEPILSAFISIWKGALPLTSAGNSAGDPLGPNRTARPVHNRHLVMSFS